MPPSPPTRRACISSGRLATYKYYNMDQVVAQALATFDQHHGAQGRWRGARERHRRLDRSGQRSARPRGRGDGLPPRIVTADLEIVVESDVAVWMEDVAEPPVTPPNLFRSFLMGGIECSTHRRRDGVRVDPLATSGHAARHAEDAWRFADAGMRTLRSGVRWPLAEPSPGRYRLRAAADRAASARIAGVEVIWDLCHYGYPDGLDPFSPAFVDRFAAYARAAARALDAETDGTLWLCPVNEISFWAWAGGDVGYLNPHAHGRGFEFKVHLARAALAAIDAVRAAVPSARFVHAEPLIHIAAAPERPDLAGEAEAMREAQFQAFDLLSGRLWPGIGGYAGALDIVGVNHYPSSQWVHGAPEGRRALHAGDPDYKPLADLLVEVSDRYRRPILLAETGAEGDARVPWMAYACAEARGALSRGVPLDGICLYPALDYPGWDDDRPCPTGLFGGRPAPDGARETYAPLADELTRQRRAFAVAGVPGGRL